MFNDIDEVLQNLLIRDIPIKNHEIDISFQQPRREWSARLSRPTLNVFLFDLRENTRLRGSEQWRMVRQKDGSVAQYRNPVRINLNYIITAWAKDPQDEHNLLARALMVLLRYPDLPKDLLTPTLAEQPVPIPIQTAQSDILEKPTDLWNTMDNESKAGIVLMVTLAIDPYLPVVSPIVRRREIRFGQAEEPSSLEQLQEEPGVSVYWTIGGHVHQKQNHPGLQIQVAETGASVSPAEDGQFTIGHLREGKYTLNFVSNERVVRSDSIIVPAPDYEFTL